MTTKIGQRLSDEGRQPSKKKLLRSLWPVAIIFCRTETLSRFKGLCFDNQFFILLGMLSRWFQMLWLIRNIFEHFGITGVANRLKTVPDGFLIPLALPGSVLPTVHKKEVKRRGKLCLSAIYLINS